MEAEIAHLKQENGILRDAVSNTTNQLENKYVSKCFFKNWTEYFHWIIKMMFDSDWLYFFYIYKIS